METIILFSKIIHCLYSLSLLILFPHVCKEYQSLCSKPVYQSLCLQRISKPVFDTTFPNSLLETSRALMCGIGQTLFIVLFFCFGKRKPTNKTPPFFFFFLNESPDNHCVTTKLTEQ